MKSTMLGRAILTAVLLSATAFAGASNGPIAPAPGSDEAIAQKVRHEIAVYPHYTIWDDINLSVNHGAVELTGAVSQPYKKSDLTKIIQRVAGVTGVTNRLEVLPLSPMDDRLRLQVARAIYGNPNFVHYATPIHIIVDNGHVTLTGVVANSFDKQLAGMRAATAGLSFGPVNNNLRIETPPAKKG